ncbi:DEAD/DEAH box helicase [bacterium]|nr:DEAD/DEAH box helicase [bacterium]MBU1983712.1 DEAD/DEAH box helicase [bacterium]
MIGRFLQLLEEDRDLRWGKIRREYLPPKTPLFDDPRPPLPESLRDGTRAMGIHRLYSHQVAALQAVRERHNVIVVTPTASGKTLSYLLPILESLLDGSDRSGLLLFPLKALEQDQRGKIRAWEEHLADRLSLRTAVFDGDTPRSERAKIKANPPHLLISNPDMLHQGILAYHQGWTKYFQRLDWIVIDELHAYRGVFGSHVVQVLRRLSRLLAYHGANPRFICLSATIANPLQLAETLTGRTFQLVEESGAPSPGKHVVLIEPAGSATTTAAKLFVAALDLDLKTIVFTKSRVSTEVIHRMVVDTRGDLAPVVSSYRAGYLPGERREIERRLSAGELQGVISTSALELGIDIGGLDVCILVGYPGSVMSFWQRAGRVGRSGAESAVVLIAGADALDRHFVTNPHELLGRPCEAALVNEENEEILRAHLPAAAAEIPLMREDPHVDVHRHAAVVSELEREGLLIRSATGHHWFPGRKRPHATVNLRNVGGTFEIFCEGDKRPLGEVSGNAVFRECHEGAVYLHCGQQYRVLSLDIEHRQIRVKPVQVTYYTMVRSEKQTEIIDERDHRAVRSAAVHLGKVKVTETFHSFERRRTYTQELLSVEPLDFPPQSYVTDAVWVEIPKRLTDSLAEDDLHPMGGIHAVEHAAISLVPLFCLCDRNDVGGISFTRHPQLEGGAIFLYDGYPGGAGIANHVFHVFEDLLHRTLRVIADCGCEEGCPSCIQSPKCGSGNKPLDKRAAMRALQWLLGEIAEDQNASVSTRTCPSRKEPVFDGESYSPRELPTDKRICVVDLETQLSAEEVGGWDAARQMRVAVGVVWDSTDNTITTYDESKVDELIAHLKRADLIIGFNILRFDYEVLRGYTFENLRRLPTLDLLLAVQDALGRRLKLDTLVTATLGLGKTADGLQSLRWFKEGRLDLVTEYCIHDVEMTRDLLLFALQNGYLLYDRSDVGSVRIPLELNLSVFMHQPQAAAV